MLSELSAAYHILLYFPNFHPHNMMYQGSWYGNEEGLPAVTRFI
jgi:hypothetical protein